MKKLIIAVFLLIPLFLKSQDIFEVDTIMNRLYMELTDDYSYSMSNWMLGDCITDNSEVGGENLNDLYEFQKRMIFETNTCDSYLELIWTRDWDVIMLSNKVLVDLPNTYYSSNEKKQLGAEAKFLRSLMYFELTKKFGGVPLYLDTSNCIYSNTDFYGTVLFGVDWKKEKSSIAEVYTQIKNDLIEIIPDLSEKSELATDAKYRATKGAARALLAKIYLYQSSYAKNYPNDERFEGLTEQWDEALNYAEEVINSDEYMLTGINGEKYSTFWDKSYLYPDLSSAFRYIFSVPGNYCSESIFEARNVHKEWLSWATNYLTAYTTCRYYEDPYITNGDGWGFNIPTQNLIDAYASESGDPSNDPRFPVTIARQGDSIRNKYDWKLMNFSNLYIATACRKFECSYEEFWSNRFLNSPLNIPIIRYADVVLMAAEASLMVGDLNKSLLYLNQVRERARMSGTTGYPADLMTISIEDIINERRLELALEGHRFYDLVRWGIAYNKLNGRYNATFSQDVVFTKGKDEFLPIPDLVVRSSEGIVEQNCGYDQLCPYLDDIEDLYITSSCSKSDLKVSFSSDTLSPVTKLYTSDPSKVNVELNGDVITVLYSNLSNYDSIQVRFSVFPISGDSISTTFKIKVVNPSITLNIEDINIVKSELQYNSECKLDLSSQLTGPIYDVSVYDEEGIQTEFCDAYYEDIVNVEWPVLYLKFKAWILMSRYLNNETAKDFNLQIILKSSGNPDQSVLVPVNIYDFFPVITIENRSVTKDEEFSIPIRTSYIDTATFSIVSQRYLQKINSFSIDIFYNADELQFIETDYSSSIFNSISLSNDSISEADNYLFVECQNTAPVLGKGNLVNLRFKALKTVNTDLKVNWLYYTQNSHVLYEYEINNINSAVEYNYPIVIYPNPANSRIIISARVNQFHYSVFDVNGRHLFGGMIYDGHKVLDISMLNQGIYFVQIETSNSISMEKFIKQ